VKAVRYHGRKDIRVETVKEPSRFGSDQLLVKPLWTGICGTDLHEYIAGPIVTSASPHVFTAATLPQILGHEFSAEVVDVGKDVAHLKRGDRVSIQPLVMPMNDYYSRRGLNHLSEKMGCIGLSWEWGGMSELAVINEYNAAKVPDSISDEEAAMIEPAAVALYAVDRGAVQAGSTVLIAGAGPIGALTILCAHAAGAAKIFVSEPNASRRKTIESWGICAGAIESPARRRGPGRPACPQGLDGSDVVGAEGYHHRGDVVLSHHHVAVHHRIGRVRQAADFKDHRRSNSSRRRGLEGI
jgi:(R,R)-butanediol dehydrogenase / meso-butanediol dehydrogenase / diacetyl reductase